MGKRVLGASRLRKKLLNLPLEVQSELRTTIAVQAALVRNEMRSRAPTSQEGMPDDWEGKPREHLRDAIDIRISKNGLNARIGLIGKRVMKVFFFARFLEFGFKHSGSGKFIKIPFMFPAWQAKREGVRAAVRKATLKALHTVATRPTSDV